MIRTAIISDCGTYRYALSREWDATAPFAAFVMLNPSTADGAVDDATIRKCIGFAKRWGMGGIKVGNLFAFRATKPANMLAAEEPEGPDNRAHLEAMAREAHDKVVIAAWGANGAYRSQDRIVMGWLDKIGVQVKCLRVTQKSRMPEHPLYVPYDTVPCDYEGRP